MPLPIPLSTKPMEAEPVDALPRFRWSRQMPVQGCPAGNCHRA